MFAQFAADSSRADVVNTHNKQYMIHIHISSIANAIN